MLAQRSETLALMVAVEMAGTLAPDERSISAILGQRLSQDCHFWQLPRAGGMGNKAGQRLPAQVTVRCLA